MTPETVLVARWTEDNNRYLAASLHWLRLRLEWLAPEAEPAAVSAAAPPTPSTTVLLAPEPHAPQDPGERIRVAADERSAAAAGDPPPALVLLAQLFGLSPFERDILLLCAAMELDTGLGHLCARVQGPGRDHPTFGLALSALDDPAWEALAPHRPLRYARLIEVAQPGGLALTASPLRADERIVNFLKGLNALDDRLATLLEPAGPGADASLSPSQQTLVDTILARLEQGDDDVLPVVQLVGADTGSKLAVARQAAEALDRVLYRVGTESLPVWGHDLDELARLWQRESVLLPIALYVDAEEAGQLSAEAAAAFHRFLAQGIGPAFVGVLDAPLRLRGSSIAVEVARPTAREQRAAWAAVLGPDDDESGTARAAAVLAGQFDVNLTDIQESAALARSDPAGHEPFHERLWVRCRDLTRPRLDELAQRLEPKATWDDLVLPDEPAGQLRAIAGQVRHRHTVYEEWGFAATMNRGFGISALFAGESGTGKTMAAEVIANDLRLDLYRIDLSGVVSKYVGETEKNLRKLFDAAEHGGAILLFDEADSLFCKRGEVRDSHDRYANIEVNYLLQRMEAFTGLAILATNLKSALDPAFLRRLRFVVDFQFPGTAQRKRMWARALPPRTPTEDLDLDRLARLALTGGTIHNIALNAAFMAARNGQLVTMSKLLDATRMELRKLDKPFNEAELR